MPYESGYEILHSYTWLAAYVGWVHLLVGLAMAVGGYLSGEETADADATAGLPAHSPTVTKVLSSVPGIFVASIGMVLLSWTVGG